MSASLVTIHSAINKRWNNSVYGGDFGRFQTLGKTNNAVNSQHNIMRVQIAIDWTLKAWDKGMF